MVVTDRKTRCELEETEEMKASCELVETFLLKNKRDTEEKIKKKVNTVGHDYVDTVCGNTSLEHMGLNQ